MAFADLCPNDPSEASSPQTTSDQSSATTATCPSTTVPQVDRRGFVQVVGSAAASASVVSVLPNVAFAKESGSRKPETLVQSCISHSAKNNERRFALIGITTT